MKPRTAVLVFVVAAGCGIGRTRPPEAALPGEYMNRGRLEAMLSIHAYFFWPDGRFPDDVRPMPLEDAADYLAKDTGWFARSRRRRAIGRLAAVGLQRRGFKFLSSYFVRRRFHRALRILGADPEEIERALRRLAVILDRPPTLEERETFVIDLYRALTTAQCDYQKMQQSVSPVGSPTASYTVSVWVPRGLGDVAKAIDPQTWDHCSKYYCPPEHTYLAHKDSKGNVVTDPAHGPGGSYCDRTLYERFFCPLQDCKNATFENLLNVSTSYDSPSGPYHVLYGLYEYLKGSIDGYDPSAVRVLFDYGQLRATEGLAPDGSGARGIIVYADKTLLLSSSWLTGVYHGAIRLIEAELGGELAEIACCEITRTIPTQCP
jgi:hypothetical protein